jgi:hypothetical protein
MTSAEKEKKRIDRNKRKERKLIENHKQKQEELRAKRKRQRMKVKMLDLNKVSGGPEMQLN